MDHFLSDKVLFLSQIKPYGCLKETSQRISLGSFLQKLGQSTRDMMFQNEFVSKGDIKSWEKWSEKDHLDLPLSLCGIISSHVRPDGFIYSVDKDLRLYRHPSSSRQYILEIVLSVFSSCLTWLCLFATYTHRFLYHSFRIWAGGLHLKLSIWGWSIQL